MGDIIFKKLSLPTLQEKGLSSFFIIDIRSKQAFLSAHLQDSLHASNEQEVIDSLQAFSGGGGNLYRKNLS
uniref:Rhodanese domain-containing protein n=1 Tax=uncultured Helicobacter sp. TaxID=175537 RepID=A0A650EKE0_9HELI|nr:hypothetical protein Helico6505_0620 [uncultured Helicobacter sp.]